MRWLIVEVFEMGADFAAWCGWHESGMYDVRCARLLYRIRSRIDE